jgi:hypothetical protein
MIRCLDATDVPDTPYKETTKQWGAKGKMPILRAIARTPVEKLVIDPP